VVGPEFQATWFRSHNGTLYQRLGGLKRAALFLFDHNIMQETNMIGQYLANSYTIIFQL